MSAAVGSAFVSYTRTDVHDDLLSGQDKRKDHTGQLMNGSTVKGHKKDKLSLCLHHFGHAYHMRDLNGFVFFCLKASSTYYGFKILL